MKFRRISTLSVITLLTHLPFVNADTLDTEPYHAPDQSNANKGPGRSDMMSETSQGWSQPSPLLQLTRAATSGTTTYVRNHSGNTFRTPVFTRNKLHQYLGISSLLLGGLAAITAPDEEEDNFSGGEDNEGVHHNVAVSATALGIAAVATGFLFHHEDIGLENGLTDPDNLHMGLGLLGVAGYAGAVASAPEDGHGAAGLFGGLSMLLAIKMTW